MVLAGLQGIFDKATPIVQLLREDPDWEESDVYGNYSLEDKEHRLTSGPLKGSRGLGLQVGPFFFFFFPLFLRPPHICTRADGNRCRKFSGIPKKKPLLAPSS